MRALPFDPAIKLNLSIDVNLNRFLEQLIQWLFLNFFGEFMIEPNVQNPAVFIGLWNGFYWSKVELKVAALYGSRETAKDAVAAIKVMDTRRNIL